MYTYRVVPFIGQLKQSEVSGGAEKVAEQLQTLINRNAAQGWEFYRIDRIQMAISPGCLGSLMGAKVSYVGFDQVIFRRPGPGQEVEKESPPTAAGIVADPDSPFESTIGT